MPLPIQPDESLVSQGRRYMHLSWHINVPLTIQQLQEPVLVSEGMGLAGRTLPTPDGGLVGLSGQLHRVEP